MMSIRKILRDKNILHTVFIQVKNAKQALTNMLPLNNGFECYQKTYLAKSKTIAGSWVRWSTKKS